MKSLQLFHLLFTTSNHSFLHISMWYILLRAEIIHHFLLFEA
jgi:hypothetical protein